MSRHSYGGPGKMRTLVLVLVAVALAGGAAAEEWKWETLVNPSASSFLAGEHFNQDLSSRTLQSSLLTATPLPSSSREGSSKVDFTLASQMGVGFAASMAPTSTSPTPAATEEEEEGSESSPDYPVYEPEPTTRTTIKEKGGKGKRGCQSPVTWRMTNLRWLYWSSKFGTSGAI